MAVPSAVDAQSFVVLVAGSSEPVWLSRDGHAGARPYQFWDAPNVLSPVASPWYGGRTSPDGAWALGSNLATQRAARVQRGGATQMFPDAPDGMIPTTAYASSVDNQTVVGSGANTAYWARAFRWTAAGGTADLGTLFGDPSATALDVSGDGAVVVGYSAGFRAGSGEVPFRWSASGGMVAMAAQGGGTVGDGRAYAVSADGSTVVGVRRWNGAVRGFRWTSASLDQDLGSVISLGNPLAPTTALGTTQDGAWTVGRSTKPDGTTVATLWDSMGRPWLLSEMLKASGVWGYAPYDLTSVATISADGGTVSGTCVERSTQEERAFIATLTLRPLCAADMGAAGGVPGRDGVLDNNDFVAFIDAFFSRRAAADVGVVGGTAGSDGVFDNNDFVAFIDAFFRGCTV
jgi:uncharacterized membrane protein